MSNKKDLTVRELIDKAMINMSMSFPMFADLVIRIGVQIVNKPEERSCAWTDGTSIFINEPIINELRYGTPERNVIHEFDWQQMIFVLAHELMHILGIHFDRRDWHHIPEENYELWNIATDYEVNIALSHNKDDKGISQPVGKRTSGCLYDPNYSDKTAEEIYDSLLNNAEIKQIVPTTMVREIGDTGINIDKHVPIKDDNTKEEIKAKIQDWIANRFDGRSGSTALDRMFEHIFKKEPFDWKGALRRFIRSYIKCNYSWHKPSRSGIAQGLILPSSSKTPNLRIGVAIDTSGSIGNTELQVMLNHLFTILNSFSSFQVDVWCCGTRVFEETFISFTNTNKNDLKNYKLKSDGCNNMEENILFVNKKYKHNKLDALVIISDFYDQMDGNDECTKCICPIVFMSVDHKDFKKPKNLVGPVFHYTAEQKV